VIVGPEVFLVIQIVVGNMNIHLVKPVTGDGYYNMTKCMEYAADLRQVHALRDEVEVINIGCPYQETPVE